jgi:uncharacterized damage-inducible protein DinB
MKIAIAVVVFTSAAFLLGQDETPKTIAQSIGGSLRFAQAGFMAAAEAMPEAKYSFIPTAGEFKDVRSFAEQVKHVACANLGFFNEIEGKTPPENCEKGGPSKAASKAELLQYLRESFDYGNRVLPAITEKTALDRVNGPYAAPNSKLGIAAAALWHVSDHYGQIVEYLRMNGIVPPSTRQYGLRVR